jgi:dipeptidyl-peptidase 4
LSCMAITVGAEVFKTALAISSVTNWKYYDSIYTERYMQTPELNPEGYKESSPISYANKLKGNLLIIHGTSDDNVHWQNSLLLVKELQKDNKQFQTMFYPNQSHGFYGGLIRLQYYTLLTNYILEKL